MKATEQEKLRMKNYYIKNRKRLLKKQNEYRIKNKERVKQQKKEYIRKNRGKISAYATSYRKKRYIEIIKRLKNKCRRCGFNDIRALQIHHKKVKSKKYKHDYLKLNFNLNKIELLCCNCHSIEHAEFRRIVNKKYS